MNIQQNQPTNMNSFLIIWVGQMASVLGSEMTNFAITIWAWELTGKATPLSLIFFFTYTPKVIAAIFAGVLVDRWNRKYLMLLGDTMAALSTIALLLLFLQNNLQIWHVYMTGAINGLFGYVQYLAYSASMSAIVPKKHYARATAMSAYMTYSGSYIIAPALAGWLYYLIGLVGIFGIDIFSCILAVCTVLIVRITQPKIRAINASNQSITQQLTFGIRYLLQRPSLLSILIFWLCFHLFDYAALAISRPMILARSNNNTAVLAGVQFAIGIGGFIGSVVLTVWGGPKRRIHGLLMGTVLMCLGKVILGLATKPLVWMIASFLTGFFSPAIDSSNQAIWLSKVEPDVQGRVFASRFLIAQITTPIGLAMGGPLADYVFEPLMRINSSRDGILSNLFGSGFGTGMAMQFTLLSLCGVLIGLAGYLFPMLRNVEKILVDHD